MTSFELKEKFGLPFGKFSTPIEWQDAIGFSTTEEYNNNHASLYKIGITKKSLENDPIIYLYVSVSYGEMRNGGISLGSEKENLSDPINLDFPDEFFYNSKTGIFYHKDKQISPKDILLYVEKAHKKTTKKIKGFWLRLRLWYWRRCVPKTIQGFDMVLIFLLWLISGEKTKNDIWQRVLFPERLNEKVVEYEVSKTMDFFGYKAKRWSVVFFCAFHLIFYILNVFWFKIHDIFLINIFKNNFLALCYVVVTFTITESGIPSIIKSVINKITPKIFRQITFKRLKINP